MKKIVFVIMCTVLYACTTSNKKDYSDTDSIGGQTVAEFKDSVKAALTKETNDKVFGDTTGVYKAPVKVLKAQMVQEEYSRYRDVELTFKNVSNKTITGVKFSWQGVTAFNEPADMGNSYAEGYGGGFTDRTIKVGKVLTLQWSVTSRDGKKIIKAWPYEVVFADGSSWKLEN